MAVTACSSPPLVPPWRARRVCRHVPGGRQPTGKSGSPLVSTGGGDRALQPSPRSLSTSRQCTPRASRGRRTLGRATCGGAGPSAPREPAGRPPYPRVPAQRWAPCQWVGTRPHLLAQRPQALGSEGASGAGLPGTPRALGHLIVRGTRTASGPSAAHSGRSSTMHIPTVSPLLILVTSHNILLLQSLPNCIPYRQDNVRRRKDDTRMGTA